MSSTCSACWWISIDSSSSSPYQALSSCEKYPMFIFSEGPSQETWGPSDPPDAPSQTRTTSSSCMEEFVLL